MSRVVDERVVEMSFDNSNFEKNVKVSMSTLQDLKKTLDLTSAAKNIDKLSTSVNGVDFSTMSNSLDSIAKRFSTLGIVGATVVSEITKDMMGFVKSASSFITSGIKNGGLTRAMNIENARFQIQGLNGDWNALYEDMQYGVNETAYGLDSAAKVAAQLVASGMTAGDSMKSVLRGISGVAAMTNSTYDDIGQIFTTVSGNGKLMTQQLRQLASRGLNASATLAKELNKTESEINDMVSKGEIDFMTFANAMDSAFGDHAKEANKTFTGSLSNMKAALSRIGADFYSILIAQDGPLVNFFNAIKDKIDQIHNAIKEPVINFATTIGAIVNKVANGINSIKIGSTSDNWSSIASSLEKVGLNADEVKQKLIDLGLKTGVITKDMGVTTDNFVSSLKKGWLNADLFSKALSELSTANAAVGNSQEDLNAKLSKFQNVVDQVWNGDFKNAPERYQLLAEAGYDYAKVQELVNKTVDGHRLTLEDLGEEQLESIGYTQDEISAIQTLGDEAKKSGTDLNSLINSLSQPTKFDYIKDTLYNIAHFVSTIAKSIGDAFAEIFSFDEASDGLSSFLQNINKISKRLKITDSTANKLKKTFKGLFAIFDVAGYVIGSVLQVALNSLNSLLGSTDKVAGGFLDITAAAGDALVKFRDWVKYTGPLSGLFNTLSTICGAFGSILGKVFEVLGSYINRLKESPVVQAAVQKSLEALNKVLEKASKWFEKGSEKVVEFLDSLKNLDKQDLQNLGQAIKNFVTNAINDFRNFNFTVDSIPTDLINGFANGLKDKAYQLFEVAKEMAQNLVDKIKEILGIHSPSTVMYDIGQNTVKGFVNGIKDTAKEAVGQIEDVINRILSLFEGVTFSDVVVAGTIGTILLYVKKVINLVDALSYPVKSFAKLLDAITKNLNSFTKNLDILSNAVKNNINARTWQVIAEALKSVAISIGILAASMIVLSLVPVENLQKGGIALAFLAGVLGALSLAMKNTDLKNMGSMAAVMLALGVALTLMCRSIRKLGNLDPEVLYQGLGSVTLLITYMGALGYLVKDSKNVKGLAATMIGVAVAIRALAGVVKQLGELDLYEAIQGTVCVGVLIVVMGYFAKLVGESKKVEHSQVLALGALAVALGISIKLMASSIKQLGAMSENELAQGIGTLIILYTMLQLFVEVSKYAGEHADKAGSMLLKMSVAMGIMVIVIKAASMLDKTEISKGIKVIGMVEALFLAFVYVSKYAGEHADKAGSMLLKMSVAMGIMVIVIKAASALKNREIQKGIKTIAKVEALFVAFVYVSKYAGEHADKAGSMLLKMSAAMLVLAIAIAILSIIDEQDLKNATACVDSTLIIMGCMVKVCEYGEKSRQATETMKQIMKCVIAVAACVAVLSILDPNNVRNATFCMDSLMAMVAVLMAATKYKADVEVANKTIFQILAIVTVLAAILVAMSELNTENAITNAAGISILLFSISGSLLILKNMNEVNKGALISLTAMSGIVAILGAVLAAMSLLGVQNAIPNALALSILLAAMSAVLILLTKMQVQAKEALKAVAALDVFILGLLALTAIVGGVNEVCDGALGRFVHESIPILSDMGTALGSMIGNFFAAINDTLIQSFIDSMTQIINFLNGIKIDKTTTESVKNLAEAILILTAAEFLDGFSRIKGLFGSDDDTTWITKFESLGEALSGFSKKLKGVKPETFKAASEAAAYLTPLIESMPKTGGKWQEIFGEQDIEVFGKKLKAFAKSMKRAQDSWGDTVINAALFSNLAAAGQGLADLQESLEPIGGKWQEFFGEADLGAFGTQLEAFATSMMNVSTTLGKDGINIDAIGTMTKAAKKLVNLKNNLGNDGGVLAFFTGDNNFAIFGMQLEKFAQSMVTFSDKCKELNSEVMNEAIKMVKKLKGISDGLKEDGMDLSPFNTALNGLGDKLSTFYNKISNIDWEMMTTATSNIKKLCNSVLSISGQEIDVNGFTNAIAELAKTDMEALATAFADTSTVTTQIQTLVTTLTTGLANGITTGGAQVQSAARTMVSQVITSFATSFTTGGARVTSSIKTMLSNAINAARDKYQGFSSAGKHLMNGLTNGFTENKSKIKTTVKSAVNDAKDAARDKYQGFYNAGQHLVNGFAAGISDNTFKAEAQARAMASKALEAAKEALNEHSPSKEMYKVGQFFVQGFSNAIEDNTSLAENTARAMANRVLGVVSTVGTAVQTAMNMGDTIPLNFEPVLDSSNFGDYSWSGLLNGQLANLSLNEQTISLIDMCNKIQNEIIESNEKVVNAINDLREDMGTYYENSDSEISLYLDSEKMTNAVTKNLTRKINHMNKLK